METKKIRNGGFTLLETLLTVAILIILMALSAVGVARYKDYLDVTELDNAARDIYMAAENRAVLLQNSGASIKLLSSSAGGTDTLEVTLDDGTKKKLLKRSKTELVDLLPAGTIDPELRKGDFYVLYDPETGHVAEVFYAKKGTTIDGTNLAQFRTDRSARVNLFRGGDPLVGYYNGGIAGEIGTKPLPTPGVEVFIDNGEELTLKVTYTRPEGLPAGVTYTPSVELDYQGTKVSLLKDNLLSYPSRSPSNVDGGFGTGSYITYTWVLDSLAKDAGGKSQQFKDLRSGLTRLGGNFTVTAGLTLTAPEWIDSAYYAEGTDNSLFAKQTGDGDTAYIANLRHLQNLRAQNSTFTSGVGNSITKAIQIENIECSKYKEKEYNFVPIYNASLTLYEGNDHEISNLYVDYESNAGLFERIADISGSAMTIQNLTMIAPNVRAAVNAGAVVGRVGYYGSWVPATATIQNVSVINAAISAKNMGDNPGAGGVVGWVGGGKTCSISSCRVYWNDASQLTDKNGEIVYKIDGQNAGGLVGSVGNGGADLATCKISNSYASTTVKAEGSKNDSGMAGGLIGLGYFDDHIEIKSSYADCYIKNTEPNPESSVGGLVGRVPSKSTSNAYVKITNCYAAGFIDGTSVHPAGLFYGELPSGSKVTNCYSVVRVIKKGADGKETLEKPATPLYFGWDESSPGSAFYLSKAGEVTDAVKTALGDAFEYEDATPETHVYDLRHQLNPTANPTLKLTPPYPFPGLADVIETADGTTEPVTITFPHYGDWAELEGSSGARLVYYEKYNDDSCGVWGADADGAELQNLKNDTDNPVVTKDGYALVFEGTVPSGYTIEYGNTAYAAQTWTLNSGTWSATDKDNQTAETFPVGVGGKTYTLVPLPSEIVLKAWKNMSQSDSNFYRKLVCGKDEDAVTYWFNPHFAKTVHTEKPTADPTTEDNCVYVRTPRHFWNLGTIEYKQTYSTNSNQVYVSNKAYYFQQELDLDFATYDKDFAGIDVTKGYNAIGRNMSTNTPNDNTFRGTYDGQGHAIQNLGREYYNNIGAIGLFGYSSGTLKNIVYHMDKFDCSVMGTNWGCAGGLAAHSTGAVENCTVIIQMGELIGKGGASYPGVLGAGGLVGYNGGSIVDSRVISENPPEGSGWAVALETVQKSDSSYAYVGGLVGVNNGIIRFSVPTRYSATIETLSTTSGYYRYLGGVAGRNDQNGTLENWTVSITDMSVGGYAGGLVGWSQGDGGITNCTATVTNLNSLWGYGQTGGLAGYCEGTVKDCTAEVTETLHCSGGGATCVGGLVGWSKKDTRNCRAKIGFLKHEGSGPNSNDHDNGRWIGGLVGRNEGTVETCKATVNMLELSTIFLGSAADVGCLVGRNEGTVKGCMAVVPQELINAQRNAYVGGLVGYNTGNGIIQPSWVAANDNSEWNKELPEQINKEFAVDLLTVKDSTIRIPSGWSGFVGGLVGYNAGIIAAPSPDNAANWGRARVKDLIAEGDSIVGGLVGTNAAGTWLTGWNMEITTLKNTGTNYLNDSPIAYVGGLAGQNEGVVDSCTAKVGTLTDIANSASKESPFSTYVGGLVGCNQKSGEVKNGKAEVGNLTNSSPIACVGGLMGSNIGSISGESSAKVVELTNSGRNAEVGGLVGRNDSGTIQGVCSAEVDTLTTMSAGYVGGLAGKNTGTIAATEAGEQCSAKVGTLTNSGNFGSVDSVYVGGLVGYNDRGQVTGCTATVTGLLNEGSVNSAIVAVGGLVGYNYDALNSENHTAVIENCAATVTTLTNSENGKKARVGGLVGYNCSDKVEYCQAAITGGADVAIALVNTGWNAHVGGLVGHNEKNSANGTPPATLSYCDASVAGISNEGGSYSYVGGLVGCNGSSATIIGGGATVSSTLQNNDIGYVGGLVGCNRDYTSSIQHSWAIVAEFTNSRIGSLIGSNVSLDVKDCTANRDPMVGSGSIDISNQVVPDPDPAGYSGAADAVAAALPPEQPEGVKGRRKKSRREIG